MTALFVASLAILLAGGLGALVVPKLRIARLLGLAGAIVGCALGLAPAIASLAGGGPYELYRPWAVPAGSFAIAIDPLTALFLLPTFGLGALAALSGLASLDGDRQRSAWFFYDAMIASMALVLAARNGILFLSAWETLAVTSFFLVTHDDDRAEVRQAGWVYLVAAHLGTAFLLVLFAIVGHGSYTLDFDRLSLPHSAALSTAAFIMAVLGFGTKAGFVPTHVWLPEAHPAAPSHVSAVMSGALIATGIYGLLRFLLFLGSPPLAWGI
ncbi:MAG: hypothetical protein KGR26_08460 [Cyanobacteria bacterium REEB65]|nr:hypothetical protein [Cyanobacteria bacterium REEB65]